MLIVTGGALFLQQSCREKVVERGDITHLSIPSYFTFSSGAQKRAVCLVGVQMTCYHLNISDSHEREFNDLK